MARRFNPNDVFSDLSTKKDSYLDGDIIKEMRSKVSVVQILSDEYGLVFEQRNQSHHRGHCPYPDHRDSSPSFDIDDETGYYKCWGCGRHGDLINFFMDIDGLSFREALNKLSILSGVSLEDYNSEIERILHDTKKMCTLYQNLGAETDLPCGMAEINFLRIMTQRIREYEININSDKEEIEWIDLVYKNLDKYDNESNHEQMSKMWGRLETRIKERYTEYSRRVKYNAVDNI
jgi:hypothetical protein